MGPELLQRVAKRPLTPFAAPARGAGARGQGGSGPASVRLSALTRSGRPGSAPACSPDRGSSPARRRRGWQARLRGSPEAPRGCLNYSLEGPGKTADFRPPGGLPMERVKIRFEPCRSDSTPLVQIGIYGVSSFGRCRSDSRRPFLGSSGKSIAGAGLDVCNIFQPLPRRGVQGGWLLLRIGSFQAKSCRVDSTPGFGPKRCIKRPSWEVMRG